MEYQRENGRINGLRTKREHARNFAEKMVPLLAQARSETAEKYPGEGHSLRALAEWLNNQKPPIPAKGGGRWQPTQITRLLETHITLIEDIEKQFELEYHMREYVRATPDYPNREHILAGLADIELKREDAIHHARQLGADLAGTRYVGKAIPTPLSHCVGPHPASSYLSRELEKAEGRIAEKEVRAKSEWAKARLEWAQIAEEINGLGPHSSNLITGLSPEDPRHKSLIERQRKIDALMLRMLMRREASRHVKKWIERRKSKLSSR